MLEEEDLPFPNLLGTFSASTCKQPKPQTANPTQNKLNPKCNCTSSSSFEDKKTPT